MESEFRAHAAAAAGNVGVVGPCGVRVQGFRFRRSHGHRHARVKAPMSGSSSPMGSSSFEVDKGARAEFGGDVRWRPSSNLGADFTYNPGFRAGRCGRGGHQPHALRSAGAREASVLPRRHRNVQPALPAVPQPADGRHHLGREVERQDWRRHRLLADHGFGGLVCPKHVPAKEDRVLRHPARAAEHRPRLQHRPARDQSQSGQRERGLARRSIRRCISPTR